MKNRKKRVTDHNSSFRTDEKLIERLGACFKWRKEAEQDLLRAPAKTNSSHLVVDCIENDDLWSCRITNDGKPFLKSFAELATLYQSLRDELSAGNAPAAALCAYQLGKLMEYFHIMSACGADGVEALLNRSRGAESTRQKCAKQRAIALALYHRFSREQSPLSTRARVLAGMDKLGLPISDRTLTRYLRG